MSADRTWNGCCVDPLIAPRFSGLGRQILAFPVAACLRGTVVASKVGEAYDLREPDKRKIPSKRREHARISDYHSVLGIGPGVGLPDRGRVLCPGRSLASRSRRHFRTGDGALSDFLQCARAR